MTCPCGEDHSADIDKTREALVDSFMELDPEEMRESFRALLVKVEHDQRQLFKAMVDEQHTTLALIYAARELHKGFTIPAAWWDGGLTKIDGLISIVREPGDGDVLVTTLEL